MKHLFLLLLFTAFIISNLHAQKYANIGVEITNYKNGDTIHIDDDAMNPLIVDCGLTNYGLDTLKPSDTLYIALKINGSLIIEEDFTKLSDPDSITKTYTFNFPDFKSWPTLNTTGSFCVEVRTSASVNDTVQANNTSCVSLYITKPTVSIAHQQQTVSQDIIIFPNPSKGSFTIKGVDNVTQVDIYNISGQVVYKNQTASNNNIKVVGLSNGLYFIQLVTPKGILTKKVMVNN